MDTETAQESGDDLRETIMAAMDPEEEGTEDEGFEENNPEEVLEEAPKEEVPKEKSERDEKGRFKKKSDIEEKPEEAGEKEPGEEEVKDEKPDVAPPQHWKGAGKVDWNKLPQNVKQAISEDYKTLQEQQERYQGLEQVLEPRRDALAANYGSVEGALDYLFKLSDFAGNDPQGFLQWFAQQRGVNLQAPQEGQPNDGQQAGEGTQLQAALQKIQQLEQQISQLPTQLQQQSQQGALQSQIESFASDPKNVYFNDVKHHMAGLLQSGAAETLEQAYDMAIHADPSIRQSILQEQREKEAEEKRKKAEAAKKAASSMSGSPIEGASMGDEPAGSIREEIVRAMNASRI